jgi:hypothetical protein
MESRRSFRAFHDEHYCNLTKEICTVDPTSQSKTEHDCLGLMDQYFLVLYNQVRN